jgi:hypothetical protein
MASLMLTGGQRQARGGRRIKSMRWQSALGLANGVEPCLHFRDYGSLWFYVAEARILVGGGEAFPSSAVQERSDHHTVPRWFDPEPC